MSFIGKLILRGRKQFQDIFLRQTTTTLQSSPNTSVMPGLWPLQPFRWCWSSRFAQTYAQVFDVEKHEMAVVASSFMATMQSQRKPLMLSHVCFDWADKLLARRAARRRFIEKDLALRAAAAKQEHEIRAALKAEAARVKAKTYTPSTGTRLSPPWSEVAVLLLLLLLT